MIPVVEHIHVVRVIDRLEGNFTVVLEPTEGGHMTNIWVDKHMLAEIGKHLYRAGGEKWHEKDPKNKHRIVRATNAHKNE